jgi:hypothetical protein
MKLRVKLLFAFGCSFFIGSVLSSASYALIIDTSVSAYVSHQVNDHSAQYYVNQSSIELTNGYPSDIGTGTDDAGGGVNSRIIADNAGSNFIVSSARNGWIESYLDAPENSGDAFQAYSFRNKTEVTRKALITNDSSDDVELTFDYLINGGGMDYYVPDLLSEEYLSLLYSIDIVLNGQSIWFSGGGVLTGERFTAPGVTEFIPVIGSIDLNGSESSWSHYSGVSYDTKMNYWSYSWDEIADTIDLGVVKAGETIELEYRYMTRVSGNIEQCTPVRDSEIPIVGCFDSVASSKIGHGIWGGDNPTLLDHSTIKAHVVDEPASTYLLLAGLFGIFMSTRKRYSPDKKFQKKCV